MTLQRKFFLQKWGTILGGFLCLLPNGITWMWGNLSVYVFSYSGNSNEVQTPWLLSLHSSLWGLGMIGASLMEKKLGRKITTAIGMTLYTAGFTISYFILDSSIDLLNLTLGALTGIGDGVIYTTVLQSIVEWADVSEVGLITSGVIGAYCFGSIIGNQFVTRYVNPHNDKPDLVVGPTVLFGQKDILSRVPNVFLFYGAATTVLYIIALCLLRKRLEENSQKLTSANDVEHAGSELLCDKRQPELNGHPMLDTCTQHLDYNSFKASAHKTGNEGGSLKHENLKTGEFHHDEKLCLSSSARDSFEDVMSDKYENINCSSQDCRDASSEYSPKEMLKDKTFYSLWFALLLGETASVVFLNYYKIFGQVWIKDDYFLTVLGNFSACVGLGAGLVSGVILDRIGVKATVLGTFSSLCLVSTFYYFTPQLDMWLYLFSTLIFSSLSSSILPIFTVTCVKCFGKKYFSANNGILSTAIVVSNLAAPPLIQLTLSNSGWFSLFFGTAALNFISLLMLICLLRKC